MRVEKGHYAVLFISLVILVSQVLVSSDMICILNIIPAEVIPSSYRWALIQSYETHDPIIIVGNSQFIEVATEEGWSGTGSLGDPIVISGYRFRYSGHMLEIMGTDLHFSFVNNILDGISKVSCGVYLSDVENGEIFDCWIENCSIGLHVLDITNCKITGCLISNARDEGIAIEFGSTNNSLSDNVILDCGKTGITLDWTCNENLVHNNNVSYAGCGIAAFGDNNKISANFVYQNRRDGIGLGAGACNNTIFDNSAWENSHSGISVSSNLSKVFSNLVYANGLAGVELSYISCHNIVSNNIFLGNLHFGMNIGSQCQNNSFRWNDFLQNEGKSQGCDNGTGNVFNYNYYDDWTKPDLDADGIVDLPYLFAGTVGNADLYPQTHPNNPFPDWYTPTTTSTISTITTTTENETSLLPSVLVPEVLLVLGVIIAGFLAILVYVVRRRT